MMRTLLFTAAMVATAFPAWPEEPAPDTIIRLRVQPAPDPKPALRYQLLPELSEMNPGNPIQGYLKCFMEQNHFFHSKEALEREKWLDLPLKNLPLDRLHDYGRIPLRQADYAARLDTVDWQTLHKLKTDGIYMLLPEVQEMRYLGLNLKIRFRAEIAVRRFDDALVTAKTMFALARHLGEHPTLIGNLVGVAIANWALDPLEEMIQQPGCPNLYWAFAYLPEPLVGFHKGLQGERVMLFNEFAVLDDQQPMTAAQLEKATSRFERIFRGLFLQEGLAAPAKKDIPRKAPPPKGGQQNEKKRQRFHEFVFIEAVPPNEMKKKQPFRDWLEERSKDEAHVRAARTRLVEHGLARDKVDKLPALQVVFLDGKFAYEAARDDALKGLNLPYWQAKAVLANFGKPKHHSPFLGLVPSISRWRQAQARLAQRLGLLRCVEAVRMYAATHDGRLPGQLAQVKLPLPLDPFTGKDFVYELRGTTASLRGAPPGPPRHPGYNGHYEVTIRK